MSEENSSQTTYCSYHPERETLLRCSRCGKPICTSCAIQTPTGYRCKDCLKNQQKIFETAMWQDYLIAVTIAAVLSFVFSFFTSFVGFFVFLLAPVAGTVTAESVRWATKKRRSKRLYWAATAALIFGSLPFLLINLLGGGLYAILWQGIYIFLSASSFYYRLSGIEIRRR